jgi:hypothetical protein
VAPRIAEQMPRLRRSAVALFRSEADAEDCELALCQRGICGAEAIRALFDAARGEGEMVGVMEERSNTSAIALQAQMQVQSRCCAR